MSNDLINCSVCGSRMKVQESRTILTDEGVTMWRRRVCHNDCGTTTRTIEVETAITDWAKYG